jgi:hypothetical protein
MNIEGLNYMRVLITVTEPWELGETLRWQPMNGELLLSNVKDGGVKQALIRFDVAVSFQGCDWSYVLGEPRHDGVGLEALAAGKKLLCGFVGISEEQAKSVDRLDLRNWRGGLAFIGDLVRA